LTVRPTGQDAVLLRRMTTTTLAIIVELNQESRLEPILATIVEMRDLTNPTEIKRASPSHRVDVTGHRKLAIQEDTQVTQA